MSAQHAYIKQTKLLEPIRAPNKMVWTSWADLRNSSCIYFDQWEDCGWKKRGHALAKYSHKVQEVFPREADLILKNVVVQVSKALIRFRSALHLFTPIHSVYDLRLCAIFES